MNYGMNPLNVRNILKKIYKYNENKINNYIYQQEDSDISQDGGYISDKRNIQIKKYKVIPKKGKNSSTYNCFENSFLINKLLYNKHNSYIKYDKDKISLDINTKGNIINNNMSQINQKKFRENNSNNMESVEWMYLNNLLMKNLIIDKENNINNENINIFPISRYKYKNSIKKNVKFPEINNSKRIIKIKNDKNPKHKNKIIINAIDKEKTNFNEKKKFKEENQINDDTIKKRKIIDYYFLSSTGSHHYKKKVNQDSYLVLSNINDCENINIYGILNGHGAFGDKLIIEIKKFFYDFFNDKKLFNSENDNLNINITNKLEIKKDIALSTKNKNSNKNMPLNVLKNQKSSCKIHKIKLIIEKNKEKINETYEILTKNNFSKLYEAFNGINKKLHEKYDSNKNCDDSGSSINILIIFNTKKINKIISINLGNTKSILITDDKKIKELNICHTPCIKEERLRIEKNGGVIDRIDWLKVGPLRVWFKDKKYPGLTITRSLGDFEAIPLGILHEPDIKEYNIDEEKIKILVMATNSIWEFLTNDKIMDITWQYYESKDSQGASEKIVEYANKIWKIKNPNNIPDLTVSVFFFK